MHSSAQELQDQITADRIKMLYGGTWGSIVTQLIVAAIYAMIQSIQVHRGSLVVWYAALAVILLSRGLLERRHFQLQPAVQDLPAWLWRYRAGVLASGLVFGSTSFLFYPQDALAYQVFTVLLLAGLSAGALVVLVSDFVCFVIYSSALLLPAVVV